MNEKPAEFDAEEFADTHNINTGEWELYVVHLGSAYAAGLATGEVKGRDEAEQDDRNFRKSWFYGFDAAERACINLMCQSCSTYGMPNYFKTNAGHAWCHSGRVSDSASCGAWAIYERRRQRAEESKP